MDKSIEVLKSKSTQDKWKTSTIEFLHSINKWNFYEKKKNGQTKKIN